MARWWSDRIPLDGGKFCLRLLSSFPYRTLTLQGCARAACREKEPPVFHLEIPVSFLHFNQKMGNITVWHDCCVREDGRLSPPGERLCVCVCVRQRNPFKRCGGMVEGQWVKARRDDWSQGLHEWKVKILFDVYMFMGRMFVLYAFTRSFILRITLEPYCVCAAASCTQSSEQTQGKAKLKLFTYNGHQRKPPF